MDFRDIWRSKRCLKHKQVPTTIIELKSWIKKTENKSFLRCENHVCLFLSTLGHLFWFVLTQLSHGFQHTTFSINHSRCCLSWYRQLGNGKKHRLHAEEQGNVAWKWKHCGGTWGAALEWVETWCHYELGLINSNADEKIALLSFLAIT